MLVVHIITGLGIGGAESMLVQLLRTLDHGSDKHLVLTLTSQDSLRGQIEAASVTVINLSEGGKGIFGSLCRARGIFKSKEPCMVMTWLHHADLFGVLIKCLFPHIRLVWNIRCSKLEAPYLPRSNLWLVSILARLSGVPTKIVSNSNAGMQAHINAGYRADGWRVLPNGFDTEKFFPDKFSRLRLRNENSINEHGFIVGMVSRFHPMKRFELFVQAAFQIAAHSPHVHFVMVGKEVEWSNSELVGWIEDAGLREWFTLLGPRQDMPQVMNMFDVLVSSSMSEGFPSVIGEAMACGVPCVATDVGDCAYLLGDTGKVVHSGSSREISDAVLEFVEMHHETFNKIRQSARQRIINNFSIKQISNLYKELFDEFKK